MPTRAELSEVEDGHTELMRAALQGDTAAVKSLLAGGAEVNAKDNEGRTALMFAVTNLHSETARELLEHGADVNASAHDGGTALMLAASSGDIESVRALLSKGADSSDRYVRNGKTALTLAKENNHVNIVELLSDGRSQTARKECEQGQKVSKAFPCDIECAQARRTQCGLEESFVASGSERCSQTLSRLAFACG